MRIREFNLLTAANGIEALSILESHAGEVGVILTDCVMPVMDGVALVRALQSKHQRIRVIASTGVLNEARHEEMAMLGVHVFLQKPYTVTELLAALNRVSC